MKIVLKNLVLGKKIVESCNIDFSDLSDKLLLPLVKINSCNVNAIIHPLSNIVIIKFIIKINVTLQCSYTLKSFDQNINIRDELKFVDDKDFDDDAFLIDSNVLDLNPFILDMITSSIPMKPVSKGAKLPHCGKGYRVITEEDLAAEKQLKSDPRFDVLDDLDL